jgi:hypothetical protein
MRYSSKRQEQFADRGRVTVIKLTYSSGFVEYIVDSPAYRDTNVPSKKRAEEIAKRLAVAEDLAYHPLFDYKETRAS